MRQPNYRVGWYIPQQVAALTHFHSEVTDEDFLGVVQSGQALLQSVSSEFHVIIDNRKVAMSSLAHLTQMKQFVPFMNHPLLRCVVVVKPERLAVTTETLPIESDGEAFLKNVSSLSEGLQYLRHVTPRLHWHQADTAFFDTDLA